jgi:ribonuclease HII
LPGIGRLCGEYFRLGLMRGLEEGLDRAGYSPVAGVDEAGRGCLAGPVVAAAVIPGDAALPGVDDSKKLAAEQRDALATAIRATARAWAVVPVTAAAIDAADILHATRTAMLHSLSQLRLRPGALVTDALPLPESGIPCLALVKGDALAYAVACASILAKSARDRMMLELDADFPHYGFARHKGYGSPEHLAALVRFGPSPVHRLTFGPVVPRRGERAAA